MAGKGGRRPGAGRPINPLKSQKLVAEIIERNRRMKGDDNCPMPIEYWLAVLWNPAEPQDRRDRAAEICLPYTSPRLQAVAVTNPDDNRITIQIKDFTINQVEQQKQIIMEQALNAVPEGEVLPEVLDAVLADDDEEL